MKLLEEERRFLCFYECLCEICKGEEWGGVGWVGLILGA